MSLFRRLLVFMGLTKKASEEIQEIPEKKQPFRIIEQNVYTMVNTVSFSTDMQKLYLIDDGRSIEFDLTGRGLLLGTLHGQMTVATAFQLEEEEGESESDHGEAREPGIARNTKLETKQTVWTAVFHQRQQVLCLIGATEIEIRKPGGSTDTEYDYKPELHFFKIGKNTLLLRRRKGTIFVQSIPNNKRN